MAFVVCRCRELYHAGLAERQEAEAWRKRAVSLTMAGQSAQLPDSKAVRPEYRDVHSDVHSQVLHDVQDALTRLPALTIPFRRSSAA